VEEVNAAALQDRRSAGRGSAGAGERGFIAEWTITIILLLFGTLRW